MSIMAEPSHRQEACICSFNGWVVSAILRISDKELETRSLPLHSLSKGLSLVCNRPAQITLEGGQQLAVQVVQLQLKNLPDQGRKLALQLLLLGLPNACLKVASFLLIAYVQGKTALSAKLLSVRGAQGLLLGLPQNRGPPVHTM